MFGNRSLSTVLDSAFRKRNYIALWNMYRNYPAFGENFKRYLLGTGKYPYKVRIRTPTGIVSPILYSSHDFLTVNEIFCRQDYFADATVRVVVDVGSNIGVSALYFLSRNDRSRCYLFEPDTRNVEKLKLNLTGYETRYVLREEAVAASSGLSRFGIEDTGRYGGIGVETGEYIEVNCLNVNDVLREILSKEQFVDVLKIDTEGVEIATVKAIDEGLLDRIGKIYIEAQPEEKLHPAVFEQYQYGTVCQLTNKLLHTG